MPPNWPQCTLTLPNFAKPPIDTTLDTKQRRKKRGKNLEHNREKKHNPIKVALLQRKITLSAKKRRANPALAPHRVQVKHTKESRNYISFNGLWRRIFMLSSRYTFFFSLFYPLLHFMIMCNVIDHLNSVIMDCLAGLWHDRAHGIKCAPFRTSH